MRAIRATVVYMPTCQKQANFLFLRQNVPINVSTCQRAKGVSIFHLSLSPFLKVCQFSNFICQKCSNKAHFMRIINLVWKCIYQLSWLSNYFRDYGTRKHSDKKRKKHSLNKVSYNYLESPTQPDQPDHNIHTYSLFCFVVLAEKNPRKPL